MESAAPAGDEPGDRPEPDAPFPTPGMPEGRFVELPGRGTTFVREVPGPPGAPCLVLLHGWTANSALNWFATYGPLGERYRVVALDHRGHGYGLRTWRRFRLEDCADDVVALADVLGIHRVVPVGYSMGGPIAQLVWRRHPDRVAGLVLCATSRHFRTGRGGRALQGVATGLTFAARATPRSWRHRVTERVLVSRYDTSPLGRWAREQARLNDLRMIIEAGQALGSFSSSAWIGDVEVPTSVVVTERDTTVPPHRQHALADAVPGARRFPVQGGHDVCAVAPGRFVPVLLDACAAATGGSAASAA